VDRAASSSLRDSSSWPYRSKVSAGFAVAQRTTFFRPGEEVRAQAVERVEHRAELELQAALGAKLPASVLLFQALSDELARFQADPAPTVEKYPLLASLVGKRGAVGSAG